MESGTDTLGMAVARAERRKAKTTSTTRTTLITSARSPRPSPRRGWSGSGRRRSGCRCPARPRRPACGSSALIRSTVSMMFAPGCRRTMISTERTPLVQPATRVFWTSVLHLGDVAEAYRPSRGLGQQEVAVLVGAEELVVGGERRRLELAATLPGGPVHRCAGQHRPHVLQGEVHAGGSLGVDLDPHRRLLPARPRRPGPRPPPGRSSAPARCRRRRRPEARAASSEVSARIMIGVSVGFTFR